MFKTILPKNKVFIIVKKVMYALTSIQTYFTHIFSFISHASVHLQLTNTTKK